MDKRTLCFLLLFSGCSFIPSVGPNYEAPPLPTLGSWSVDDGATELFIPSTETSREWWKSSKDPELSRLIDLALTSNLSYQTVQSRVREARAALGISRGDFLPSVGGSYGLERGGRSENTPQGAFGKNPYSVYQAGLDTLWEIDILGGNRRAFEAAVAEEEGAQAIFENAGITLVAEVARNFILYRELEERVRVLEKSVAAQSESQRLAKVKFESGLTSELDLSQSTAQLEGTRAQLPVLKQAMVSQLRALAILCGQEPLSFSVAKGGGFPEMLSLIPLSQPSELLRNRPDIRSVERGLAAQTARIGVAISDLFPKFTITGALGVQSARSGSLFESANRFWSFGPGVTMPFFQGGKILSNIEVQNERTKQALYRYQETVLEAMREVQDALNSYAAQKERLTALSAASKAAERSLSLSKELYNQGLIDFLRVLEAEKTALTAEDSLIQGRAAFGTAAVFVYKAFAGVNFQVTPEAG